MVVTTVHGMVSSTLTHTILMTLSLVQDMMVTGTIHSTGGMIVPLLLRQEVFLRLLIARLCIVPCIKIRYIHGIVSVQEVRIGHA